MKEEYRLETENTAWKSSGRPEFPIYSFQLGNTVFETYNQDAGYTEVKLGPPFVFRCKKYDRIDTLEYRFRFVLGVETKSDSVALNLERVILSLPSGKTLLPNTASVSFHDSLYHREDVRSGDTVHTIPPHHEKEFHFSFQVTYSEAKEVRLAVEDVRINGLPVQVPLMYFKRSGRTEWAPLPPFLLPSH